MAVATEQLENRGVDRATQGCIDESMAAIVVVGSGPVGMRLVTELNHRSPDTPVILYGDESWAPYDRVRLSSYLAGDVDQQELQIPQGYRNGSTVESRWGCRVLSIDAKNFSITDSDGRVQRYAHLVLATGSLAFVPRIAGIDKEGVFTFRDLSDAEALGARRTRSRNTVVLGGGLLGLETARAMQRFNTQVTVVEHNDWLMLQQLDEEGGALLASQVEQRNIQVITGDSVAEILGDQRVENLGLRSGRLIPCDTLVISAGIRPRIELARQAGIRISRGIVVNDDLETSIPRIHAIGECAEHNGDVYGLVGPGWDQAAVLAARLAGGDAQYLGSQSTTRLKVMDGEVVNTGMTDSMVDNLRARSLVYRDYAQDGTSLNAYRKILVNRDRIIGALGVGGTDAPSWREFSRIQESIECGRRIWPWQLDRFLKEGRIWKEPADASVASWPDSAVVCNCRHITRGQLGAAIKAGCNNSTCLKEKTGAASVCGSCQPMISELLGSQMTPIKGARPLMWASGLSLFLALAFLLLPAIPYPDSVQGLQWDVLWRDGLVKQISGFSLLGAGVLLSLVSLRKRIGGLKLWDYAWWRMAHVGLGVVTIGILLAHTGMRLGHELNLVLMLSFVGLLLAGAMAGTSMGLQHRIPLRLGRQLRSTSIWMHILLLWPLPALLGFHILKSYWF